MDEFGMTHDELHKKVAWASEHGISSLTFTIAQLGSLAKVYASAQERIEELEGQVEITAIRARHFANDNQDVGMKHQIGRWTSIADAHEETLAAHQGEK